MKTLPVVAAIPNYNMGEQLAELLPQVREGGYDDVFVLDDASTDGSRDIVAAVDSEAKFVEHPDGENHGSGPTRNLIIGQLGHRSIIHFIDADTDLLTINAAEAAIEAMDHAQVEAFPNPVGFVGGLAYRADWIQNFWNFGPRQCAYNDLGALKQNRIEQMHKKNPGKAKDKRAEQAERLADWPNPFEDPEWRQVFWVIEQNMLFDSEIFEHFGFDLTYREHEIQDLAIRMKAMGLNRYFDPSFAIRHKETNVRGDVNRDIARLKVEFSPRDGIHRRYGYGNWIAPNGQFKPEL